MTLRKIFVVFIFIRQSYVIIDCRHGVLKIIFFQLEGTSLLFARVTSTVLSQIIVNKSQQAFSTFTNKFCIDAIFMLYLHCTRYMNSEHYIVVTILDMLNI